MKRGMVLGILFVVLIGAAVRFMGSPIVHGSWSGWGAGDNAGFENAPDAASAAVTAVVKDTSSGRESVYYWIPKGRLDTGTLHFGAGAVTSFRLAGLEFPIWKRSMKVQLVPGKNLSGLEDGFEYSVTWRP